MILLILQILSVILITISGFVGAYYILLAIYGLACQTVVYKKDHGAKQNFAILIPAHNEELSINKTLTACSNLDYPTDKYSVFVVADNCTDNTLSIAKDAGVFCLERTNDKELGKGYALEWGFSRIFSGKFEDYDAVVVLDADCVLDRNALTVMNIELKAGADVLQINNVASNPDDSPISYAVAVGNWVENELFYKPKSRLGLAVFLRGTGMVFKRSILEEYPWRAFSVAEDVEYGINLLRNKVKIKFVEATRVLSSFPVNYEQLHIQRTRWAHGNLGFSKVHAFRFMYEGVRDQNLLLFDSGLTLLSVSRPLVLLATMCAVAISGVVYYMGDSILSTNLFIISMLLAALYVLYFLLGVFSMGVTVKRFVLMIKAPFVVMKLIKIAVTSLLNSGKIAWVRSPRSD